MTPIQRMNRAVAMMQNAVNDMKVRPKEVDEAIARMQTAQGEGHFTHPDIVTVINYALGKTQ